jgi:hypothetical protein
MPIYRGTNPPGGTTVPDDKIPALPKRNSNVDPPAFWQGMRTLLGIASRDYEAERLAETEELRRKRSSGYSLNRMDREDDERQDRKRDVANAIEQSERSAETKSVSENTWTPDDWAVAAIGALVAIPLCEAGWHAVVNEPEHFARGIAAIAIGLPLGLAGFSFHRWKTKIPAEARHWIGVAAFRWWPVAVFLTFGYFALPVFYHRIFSPQPTATATSVDSQKSSQSSSQVGLCSDGPCAPVRLKPNPEYLKGFGLGVGGPEPLMLTATPAITDDRLRVFVDYSEYRSGWMPKTRAFIGEIKEPVKGKTEKLQLIYYLANKPNAGTNKLWWGDPSQDHPVMASTFVGAPLPVVIVRARLAIVGPNGEQHYYFILLRGIDNVGTYVGVIPQHDTGDWIEKWEAD